MFDPGSIDLMLDCKFDDEGAPVRVIHIVELDRGGFNVVVNGRVTTGLGWGEALEQVIELIHPKLRGTGKYPMVTREEHFAERARHEARMAENARAREQR